MVRKELVLAGTELDSREAVIDYVATAADGAGLLASKVEFVEAVYRREEEISTSIGHGIAIPHGKTDAVKEAFMAFVSVKKPFCWDENSKDKILGVFLIGVPQSKADTLHLKAIAAISKRLINDDFRSELFACRNSEEAYRLLDEIDQGIK